NVQSSGVVPQISAIMGPCAGGAVYSPAMTDFIFMVEDTSYMFITGPDVVKTVTGEDVTQQELGGALTHATKSGVCTFTSADDKSCLDEIRYLLSFLPSNNLEDPPVVETGDDPDRLCPELSELMPSSPRQPYDMHKVIGAVIDDGDFFEYGRLWAQNIICGFARIDGHCVGVVGNQPQVLGGVLDIESSEKAARFVRTCDALTIPLVTFVDVPGFLPGVNQEYGGVIKAWGQAAVRILRGHRASRADRDPEGVRRGLCRHGLQVHRFRPGVRVADRGARRDGPAGSGRDHLSPRVDRRCGPRRSPQRARRR